MTNESVSTEYQFAQVVNRLDSLKVHLLQNMLEQGVETALENLETNGTGADMIVSLWFADALDEANQNRISEIMANYIDPVDESPQMVNAIIEAIQTDVNLIIVLRTQVTKALSSCTQDELQSICDALGITP